MNGLNKELLRLTTSFIEEFKKLYQAEDKTATDSYVVNMMLPDYLSAALPVDMERVFYAPLMTGGVVSQFVKAEYKKNIANLAPVLMNVLTVRDSYTAGNYRIKYKGTEDHEYEKLDISDDFKVFSKKNEIGTKDKFHLSCSSNNFKADVEVYNEDYGVDRVVVVFDNRDRHVINFRPKFSEGEEGLKYELRAELPFGLQENFRNTNSFWLAMQVIDQSLNNPSDE